MDKAAGKVVVVSTTPGEAGESYVDAASCLVSDPPVDSGACASHGMVALYTTNCIKMGRRLSEIRRWHRSIL